MSYINDPRETVFDAESGAMLEQDNRVEEKYQWGSMIIDLCNLPVSEYMKPMTVIGLGGGELPDTGDTLYTLKFMVDGIIVQQESLKSGDPIPFTSNPEKDGRTFIGWYYGNTKYSEGSIMPSKSLTLTAKYECNVSFVVVTDNVEETILSYTVSYNSKVSNIPSTNKDGYIFNGWEPSVNNVITKHTVFRGEYTPIIYTVTWNGYEPQIVQEYRYGEMLVEPKNPTKEGYTFSGWDKKLPITVTSNLVFTPKFTINQYVITYSVDFNGEKTVLSSVTKNYGSEIVLPVKPNENGYSFTEWNSEYTGVTVPAFNVEYVSVKTVNSYVLNYYVNNELVNTVTYDYLAPIKPYEYVKEGYTTVNVWEGLPEVMPYNNVNVYGYNEILTFNVSFKDQNGVVLETVKVNYGTIVKDINIEIPEGYSYVISEDVLNTTIISNIEVNGILTLNNYIVKINGNNVELPFGTNIEEYINNTVEEKEGYHIVINTISHSTVPSNNSAVVEYSYVPNVLTLSYITTGADDNNYSGSVKVSYGDTILDKLPFKEIEGYDFSEWHYEDGTKVDSNDTMPNKDVNVFGEYIIKTFIVIVKDEDKIILSKSYNYGTKLDEVVNDELVQSYITESYNNGYNVTLNVNVNDVITNNMELSVSKVEREFVLTFKNGEEIISSENVKYNSIITYPVMDSYTENGVEYVFVWDNNAYNGSTMPAFDLTITGIYQEKTTAPIYYGVFVTSSTTADSKIFNAADLASNFKTVKVTNCLDGEDVIIEMDADEYLLNPDLTDEEFEEYQQKHLYPACFLIPVEIDNNYEFISVLKADNKQKNFTTDNVEIVFDGNSYHLYTYLNPNSMRAMDRSQNWKYNITLK